MNYLAEQIESYLAAQTHVADWKTARQAVPRGTGDALMSCHDLVTSDSVMVLNGDDLYRAADLADMATHPAAILAHPIDDPRKFGVVFPRDDGTLEKILEKPDLDGPMLANIGAYVFPRSVFDLQLPLSPRGEYEITDAVAMVAASQPLRVVRANFWLPIGDVAAWEAAQTADLKPACRTSC